MALLLLRHLAAGELISRSGEGSCPFFRATRALLRARGLLRQSLFVILENLERDPEVVRE